MPLLLPARVRSKDLALLFAVVLKAMAFSRACRATFDRMEKGDFYDENAEDSMGGPVAGNAMGGRNAGRVREKRQFQHDQNWSVE